MAEKLSMKDQATLRKRIYNLALSAFPEDYEIESVADGALITIDGQSILLKAVYKDPTKFNIEKAREEYIEKCEKEKVRVEKHLEAVQKKLEKQKKE